MTSIFKKTILFLFSFLMLMTTLTFNVLAEGNEIHYYLAPNEEITFNVGDIKHDQDEQITGIAYDSNFASVITSHSENLINSTAIARTGINDDYDKDIIDLDKCAYTFTARTNNSDGNRVDYTVSYTDGTNTIYLDPGQQSGNCFHSTTENGPVSLYKIDMGNGDIQFSIDRGNRYLFFEILLSGTRYNNTFYHTNRYSLVTAAEVSMHFHLYEQGENGTYSPITDYPENGKQYIIVADKATSATAAPSNIKYVMRPNSDMSSPYTQCAKWTVGDIVNGSYEFKVQANSTGGGVTSLTVTHSDNTTTKYTFHVAKVPTISDINDNIVVKDTVAEFVNEPIKKLVLTRGSKYKIGADSANADNVLYWTSADDTIASVDQDGVITALKGLSDGGVPYLETLVGFVEKDMNTIHYIKVGVINQDLSADTKALNSYINFDSTSDVVSYAFLTKVMVDTPHNWIDSDIKSAEEKEVFFMEFDKDEEYGLTIFAKPVATTNRWYEDKTSTVNRNLINPLKTKDIDKQDEFDSLYDKFGDNLLSLMTLAKNKGYEDVVYASKYGVGYKDNFVESGSNATTIYVNYESSYIIDLINDRTVLNKTYEIVKTPLDDSTDLQNAFGLTNSEMTRTNFVDISIKEDGVVLESAELKKARDVEVNVGDIDSYDLFDVYSIHNGNKYTVATGIKTDEDGNLKLNLSKFSKFAIVGRSAPKPSGYRAPNTSVK